MARKQREEENTDAWMSTYSDLVTLLLTFFVLLYSMSSIEAEKWQRFASAFSGQDTNQVVINPDDEANNLATEDGDVDPATVDNEPLDLQESLPENLDELYEYLMAYMEQHDMQDSIDVSKDENAIYIRFNNNIFFEPDKAALKSDSIPVLDFLGDCLGNVQDEIYLININGHTASVDYQYYPVSSWTLSGERATNIAIFMEDEKAIDPKKLRPIGYGNNYPVASNDTEEGRRQNRRVDMVIVGNESMQDGDSFNEVFAGLFDPSQFPASGGVSDLLQYDKDDPISSRPVAPATSSTDSGLATTPDPGSADSADVSSAPGTDSSSSGSGDDEWLEPVYVGMSGPDEPPPLN